jgi:hypothetical protein
VSERKLSIMRIKNIGGCFKKFLCIAMVAGLLGDLAVQATPGDATITHQLGTITDKMGRSHRGLIFTIDLPDCEEGMVYVYETVSTYHNAAAPELMRLPECRNTVDIVVNPKFSTKWKGTLTVLTEDGRSQTHQESMLVTRYWLDGSPRHGTSTITVRLPDSTTVTSSPEMVVVSCLKMTKEHAATKIAAGKIDSSYGSTLQESILVEDYWSQEPIQDWTFEGSVTD